MTNYNTYQNNTFDGGLNMDQDPVYVESKQYLDAQNIRVTMQKGSNGSVLQNILALGQATLEQYNNTPTVTINGVNYSDAKKDFADSTIIGTTTTYYYLDNTLQEVVLILANYNDFNSLYMVQNINTATPRLYRVCIFKDGISNKVSMVANYESRDNVKVYIADGKSYIKMINIGDIDFNTYARYLGDSGKISIYPDATLTAPTLSDDISGSLLCGVYCYTYQLVNKYGQTTSIAPLTNLIPVYNQYSISSNKAATNKGIKIELNITDDFDYAKVYRIYYSQNNSTPQVSLIARISLDGSSTLYSYQDINNDTILSDITVEELNNLNRQDFHPQTMVKLQNRLFASNITDDTWDIDYDAKAYRYNSFSTQICGLTDETGTNKYYSNVIPSLTYDDTCINPVNEIIDLDNQMSTLAEAGRDYLYKLGKPLTYGGTGINVTYEFVTATIAEATGVTSNNVSLDKVTAVGKSIKTTTQHGISTSHTIPTNYQQYNMDYSNPFISTNYVSYQRDEIYRFGIVFYNIKGKQSPVHWIGDIRMPSGAIKRFCPFYAGDPNDSNYTSDTLIGRPLGIRFTINNIPSNVYGYEIVRCNRASSDKTVITQGIITNLYKNTEDDADTRSTTDNLLRPTHFLSNAISFGSNGAGSTLDSAIKLEHRKYSITGEIDSKTTNLTSSLNNYGLITPEICFAGDDSKQIIKAGQYIVKVNALYPASSDTPVSSSDGSVLTGVRNGLSYNNSNHSQGLSGMVYKDASNNLYYNFISCGHNSGVNFDSSNYDESQSSLLYKYYYYGDVIPYFGGTGYEKSLVSKVKYCDTISSANIINPSTGNYNLSQYDVTINDYIYTNVVDPDWIKDDMKSKFGPHGPMMLLNSNSTIAASIQNTNLTVNSTGSAIDKLRSVNSIPIVNIKRNASQYGGNNANSVSSSTYVTTGSYVSVFNSSGVRQSSITNEVFGGDTYLGILEYPICVAWVYDQNQYYYADMKVASTALIPLETQYNIDLQYGTNWSQTSSKMWYQVNACSLGSVYSQDKPFFAYNSVYNTNHKDIYYLAKSLITESNQNLFNRIVTSEAKTSGEVEDSWCTFKFANYIDTDTQYGSVTNMLAFKDKLFFWQKNAFGIASVNERSLITDGNASQLTLGTGGILVRYDYITNVNGDSITNDNSISHSDSAIYWYDTNKEELILSDGQSAQCLSKAKYVQSYLTGKDKTCKYSIYDRKNNEVVFQFNEEQLVFNEFINAFTSRYNVDSSWGVSTSNVVTHISSNNVFISPVYDNKLVNKPYIKFIINKDLSYTKSFDNVDFSGTVVTGAFTSAQFKTKTQTSELVTDVDVDLREDNYRFYIPRDSLVINEEFYIPARMKGKYLICEYKFDCGDSKSFDIPYIRTTYRYSRL